MAINFRKARLVSAAHRVSQIPEPTLPAIIFAGRSNVGKSSLINLICGQKNLARVSSSPGKTQALLFYSIDDQLLLVDLPGYGYAQSGQKRQSEFNQLVDRFLEQYETIHVMLLVIDSRRGLQAEEGAILAWANARGITTRIVCNKIDQLKQRELQELKRQFGPSALYTSVTKRRGLKELREALASTLGLSAVDVD